MASGEQNVQPIESEGDENEIKEVRKDGKTIWTIERENLFISIMEEEVIKGNKVKTTFCRDSWNFIRETLSKKTKYNYSDSQVRNKFNQLRSRYNNFKKLLAETGIRFVSSTGQVIASEQVWHRLYSAHKMAKRFQKKGCPSYDKLRVIYGRSKNKIDLREKILNSSVSSAHSRTSPVNNIACAVQSTTPGRKFVTESMEALERLDGIDGAAYARAVGKFHDSELWRKLFLMMPDDRKKYWVLNLK